MWLSFDIETYEEFDGSKESAESILKDSLFSGGPKEVEEQKKKYAKSFKKGKLYPVLNSRKFKLGCVVMENGERKSFEDNKEMLNFLIDLINKEAKKGKKTFLFAHNLDYDMLGLIKDDFMNLVSSDLTIVSENPALYSWKVGEKNWGFFVDSYSFFRNMSVEKIGKIIEFPKLEMPEEIKSADELKEYCFRDCEIVLKGMQFLREKMKCIGFTPKKFLTAGQVAMSTFLSYIRKNNTHWNIMKNGEVYKGPNLEKCRPAYRGARNEAFQIGKFEKTTYVDINSLYPFAMTKIPFPKLNEEMFVEDPLMKGLSLNEILDNNLIGCAECEIRVPEMKLGYLPIRHKGVLHFPTGPRVIMGTWTTLELRRAVSLGYEIKDMKWVCLYKVNPVNVFDEYVNKLYDLRKESGEDMKLVVKLIMNNLYGKFAQFRTNKEFRVIYRDELSKWKKNGWNMKSVWGSKYIIEKSNEIYVPKYTNLLIATLITAWGRDYLYNYLSRIKQDDLIYCDTDGIVLKNWKNYKDLFKISEELGDWKIVEKEAEAIIKGEKNKKVGNEITTSGVSKKVLSGIDFEKTNSVIQKRQVSLKSALRDPANLFSKVGSFEDFEINFKATGKKDIVLPDEIDERGEWINIWE